VGQRDGLVEHNARGRHIGHIEDLLDALHSEPAYGEMSNEEFVASLPRRLSTQVYACGEVIKEVAPDAGE
jgi:hypothetical protein